MSDTAIDFRKLLLQEKKKARQKHQQEQQQQQEKAKQPLDNMDNKANGTTREMGKVDMDQQQRQQHQHQQEEEAMSNAWVIPNLFNPVQHLICSNPPTIYYIPQFLPREYDQQSLMQWLLTLPMNPNGTSSSSSSSSSSSFMPRLSELEASRQAHGCWTRLQHAKRRVALFDTTLHDDTYAMPPPLLRVVHAMVHQGIFPIDKAPNHVLVNEYHPGQGILPHTDGPAYVSRTATLSLGSQVLIQFTPRPGGYGPQPQPLQLDDNDNDDEQQQQQHSALIQWCLEPGSLLVFQDQAYLDYCHGITDRVLQETDSSSSSNGGRTITRGYRISLTFRHKNIYDYATTS